ncbi:hypothetical protein PGTUg99_004029 [Puccinia graminis f. sp. tritici]|uniref:Uncharacterized protein n=1 Tax=Puccinia graminis f. sp. tritici TaxID=56615 RepID=A0A5B0S6X0_PUCGR|nr:hypothetical protein PGTUg99_004029 [Puccinia graminis f. sp. tritici]
MSHPAEDQATEALPTAIIPVERRLRYPIIYLSYHVWVEHRVLFPDGTPSYARRSEAPRTPENWRYHHECITTTYDEVAPIPPCEVPFDHLSLRDFKRGVIELIGSTRSDFDFVGVLRAADSANKLQWRGYRTWPGGPTPRNMNVRYHFRDFARMATRAVLPMKIHLKLFMDDPAQIVGNRRYWTWIPHIWPHEVIAPFVPNGELPPPPEDCLVLGGQLPLPHAGEQATTSRLSVDTPASPFRNADEEPTTTQLSMGPAPSLSSWVIETPSSTTPTPPLVQSPSVHSSSARARSSSYFEPPCSSDSDSDSNDPAIDATLSSPVATEDVESPAANAPPSSPHILVTDERVDSGPSGIRASEVGRNTGEQQPQSSSPGIVMLDGPPSSWQSKDYEAIKRARSDSDSPDVEVASKARCT